MVQQLQTYIAAGAVIYAKGAFVGVQHLGAPVGIEIEQRRAGHRGAEIPGRRGPFDGAVGFEHGIGTRPGDTDLRFPVAIEVRHRRRPSLAPAGKPPGPPQRLAGVLQQVDPPRGNHHHLRLRVVVKIADGIHPVRREVTPVPNHFPPRVVEGPSRNHLHVAVQIDVRRDRYIAIPPVPRRSVVLLARPFQHSVGGVDVVTVDDLRNAVVIEVGDRDTIGDPAPPQRIGHAGIDAPFERAIVFQRQQLLSRLADSDDFNHPVSIDIAKGRTSGAGDVQIPSAPKCRAVIAADRDQTRDEGPRRGGVVGGDDHIGRIEMVDPTISVVVAQLTHHGRPVSARNLRPFGSAVPSTHTTAASGRSSGAGAVATLFCSLHSGSVSARSATA